MSTQSYPWFKFHHIEYLLNPAVSSLSLEAQGANTRLMAYAARQPEFGTLPINEKQLISMSGCKSFKQWQKIFNELVSNGIWKTIGFIEDGNVRLICPMMIVESAPVANQEQEEEKPLTPAERSKRYRDNKKNRDDVRDENISPSHDHHVSVTQENDDRHEASHDRHEQKVTHRDESVTIGGIKGGDLDLEQEKDLELKTLNTSEDKSSGKTPETPSQAHEQVVAQDPFTTTARQVLWTVGVPLLQEYRQTEKAARQFLGQMVKLYGEDQVAEAVTSARTTKPLDATAYIGGYLKNQAKQKIKQDTQARKQTSHAPDNNSEEWMTPELEAKLNERFAA